MSYGAYMMTLRSSVFSQTRASRKRTTRAVRLRRRLFPLFVALNMAGGMSLSGNYMVTDSGGSLLSNYDTLGLGTVLSRLKKNSKAFSSQAQT